MVKKILNPKACTINLSHVHYLMYYDRSAVEYSTTYYNCKGNMETEKCDEIASEKERIIQNIE